MRVAIQDRRRLQQTALVLSLPAPTGGWNKRNNWADMNPLDAIEMINWIPEADCVRLREGDILFAEGLGAEVETLCEFNGLTSRKLLAAASTKIFDITAGVVEKGTGFTNARWQCANFNNRTFLANGADTVQVYDGTTLADSTFTGVTLADLIDVSAVRNRLWFVEKDSANAFFGGIGAISGALSQFEVAGAGSILAAGGKLLKIENWSRDGGQGMDDFTVFIMDTGEVLIYEGDPATTFTLIGKYKGPEPIGQRCAFNQGGELIIITRGGFIPVTSLMDGFGLDPEQALSEKIRQAVSETTEQHFTNFGWEGLKHPNGKWLVFNIPFVTNQTYEQYIFNLETRAWCQFQNRNARTFGTLDGELFFGGNGKVFRADDGNVDESEPQRIWGLTDIAWGDADFRWGNDSSPIDGTTRQAFNSLDQPNLALSGRKKLVTGLRPFVRGEGIIPITVRPIFDFKTTAIPPNETALSPTGLTWGDADVLWGNADIVWGDNPGIISSLLNVGGFGETVSVGIRTQSTNDLAWYNTEIIYKPAGIMQ